jgi:hypothetical protein
MHSLIACALLVTTTAVGGCRQPGVGSGEEQAAPADQFVVTTNAGARLSGPPARIEIRHVDEAKAPDVEVVFSASVGSGYTWSVHSVALPVFLETLSLAARVVDSPLEPGTASVQVALPNAEATAAPSGLLSFRLHAGRLVGEAGRMRDEFAARFDGPFVVTCAVPAAAMASGAPESIAKITRPTLILDETFESALCRPYAALGGWAR